MLASSLYLVAVLPLAYAQCYNFDGTLETEADYQPCSNSSSDPLSTVCCAINRTNPPGGDPDSGGFTQDECLANGVCRNRWSQNGNMVTSYFREKCTEKDWSTGKCLNVCTESVDDSNNSFMTPCDGTPSSEKWCCGQTTKCCGTSNAFILPRQFGVASASAPSSTSSASASASDSFTSLVTSTRSATLGMETVATTFPATTSTTSSTSSTATPQPSSSSLSSGAKAGISVGTILGAAAVFTGGYFLARRRHGWTSSRSGHGGALAKNYDITSSNQTETYYAPAGKGEGTVQYRMATTEVQELSSEEVAVEAPNEKRWKNQELP